MSDSNHIYAMKHLHRQMNAVRSLVQPQYAAAFSQMVKVLELQVILQELRNAPAARFQASSLSEGNRPSPCSLSAFVQTLTPFCSESELRFLNHLQNTDQMIQTIWQVLQFQALSRESNPETVFQRFLTPEQQKNMQMFESLFQSMNTESQEEPNGSS